MYFYIYEMRLIKDIIRPVTSMPKARISVPSNEDVMKSFQNVKGTNLMKINNPHIDFSRSMKIPEHMNGDNLKMKSYR